MVTITSGGGGFSPPDSIDIINDPESMYTVPAGFYGRIQGKFYTKISDNDNGETETFLNPEINGEVVPYVTSSETITKTGNPSTTVFKLRRIKKLTLTSGSSSSLTANTGFRSFVVNDGGGNPRTFKNVICNGTLTFSAAGSFPQASTYTIEFDEHEEISQYVDEGDTIEGFVGLIELYGK